MESIKAAAGKPPDKMSLDSHDDGNVKMPVISRSKKYLGDILQTEKYQCEIIMMALTVTRGRR